MKIVRIFAMLWLSQHCAAATLPDAQVLLVDQSRVEQESATLQRLQAQADARNELRADQRKQAMELVLSEILTVLPRAVAAVAQARQADLVVQASAWPTTAEPPEDATDAVIAEIDKRLSQLQLVIP